MLDVLIQITSPNTAQGAAFYAAVYVLIAWVLGRLTQRAIARVLEKDLEGRIDRTAKVWS